MQRVVAPELLDALPADDPRSRKSRKDLQRINWWMGHVGILANCLTQHGKSFHRLVELGAGDGNFSLKLARQLAPQIGPMRLVLVDRLNLVSHETQVELQKLGWTSELIIADVFEWLPNSPAERETAIFANLFLHHFTERRLFELFRLISAKSRLFAACDPRRSPLALFASHLLGLIGCNAVTRHDAVVSVQAGFIGLELTQWWPRENHWNLLEKEIGLFSHFFVANNAPNNPASP